MKKGKRLLSLFLTIAMIVGLMPVNSLVVKAEENETVVSSEKDYFWKQDVPSELKVGDEYVVVLNNQDKALCNSNGTATTIDVAIEGTSLTFDESANAIWKVEASNNPDFPYVLINNGFGILQNNSVIGQGKGQGMKIFAKSNNTVILYYGNVNNGAPYLKGTTDFSVGTTHWLGNDEGVRLFKKVSTNMPVETVIKIEGQADRTIKPVFDINKPDTWFYTKEMFTGVDHNEYRLAKIEKQFSDGRTAILAEGDNVYTTKLDLNDSAVVRYICTFASNTAVVTAEFYLITDIGLLKYDCHSEVEKQEAELFLKDNNHGYKSTVTQTFRDMDLDLLIDPLTKFNVPEAVKTELESDKVSLFEVRSAKRVKNTANANEYVQKLYASNNSGAIDYVAGEWWPTAIGHPGLIADKTVKVSELDETQTIKYIYVKNNTTINYYLMNDAGKVSDKPAATISGNAAADGITVPNFAKDSQFDTVECNKAITDMFGEGVTREQLSGKKMDLFIGNSQTAAEGYKEAYYDKYVYQKEGTYNPNGEYVLNVYWGIDSTEVGQATIQLPITMFDYEADGMFFEYCSNNFFGTEAKPHNPMDESYGFSMGPVWNQNTIGLIDNKLNWDDAYPRIMYTEEQIGKIATLLNNGKIWSGKNYNAETDNGEGEGNNNDLLEATMPDSAIRKAAAALKGNKGSYQDVLTAFTQDNGEGKNIITWAEAQKSCYTLAAYMMTHFFQDDVDKINYGKKVDDIHALELREYTNSVGKTYYIYDAAWKSEVKNGVIRNQLNEDGTYSSSSKRKGIPADSKDPANEQEKEWDMSYYMPLDWLAEEKGTTTDSGKYYTYDQYTNANYLHSTVGEGNFVYEESKDLEFTFVGDDDVYLFINNTLVVDMGGAHFRTDGSVKLNEWKDKLGLKDGETYPFTFFHMERHGTGSNFKMMTNINIDAPELSTDKNAYTVDNKKETDIPYGGSVEPDREYYYSFSLKNVGKMNMYNLSFWDRDIKVQIYPKGNTTTIDGKRVESKLENAKDAKWGNIIVDIASIGDNGELSYPDINKWLFEDVPAQGHNGCYPIVDTTDQDMKNPTPDPDSYNYGPIKDITVAELYEQVRLRADNEEGYPALDGMTEEQKEEKYKELLEEILRNGIMVNQMITLKGFKYSLPADAQLINTVQTYGMTYNGKGKTGSDKHKVIARDIANVVKVIDYGKPVTYGFYEIFKDDLTYSNIKLNTNPDKGIEKATFTDIKGNTYKQGYKWDNDKLISTTDTMIPTKTKVHRGDGTGHLWNPDWKSETEQGVITNAKFTFVPDDFMDAYAKFGFEVTRTWEVTENEKTETKSESYPKYLTIYPANVVYYEDNFVTVHDDGTTTGIVYTGNVKTEDTSGNIEYVGQDNVLEQDSNAGTNANEEDDFNGNQQYGYDKNYNSTSGTGDSNGTSVILKDNGGTDYSKAEFTFKGTGFDIVGRTTDKSTVVMYTVKNSAGAGVRFGVVDTVYMNGTLYQIPVIHVQDLPYDTYTVSISVVKSAVDSENGTSRNIFYLDGIRIYNPIEEQPEEYLQEEKDAKIEKLNKMFLGDCKITEEGDAIVDSEGNYYGATSSSVKGATATLVSVGASNKLVTMPIAYTEDIEGGSSAQSTSSLLAVLRRGPNNEVYLDTEGAFAFVVKGNPYAENVNGTLQVEAKLVETNPKLAEGAIAGGVAYWDGEQYVEDTKNLNVNTSMAMYYRIPKEAFIELENGDCLVVVRGGLTANKSQIISFSNIKSKGCSFVSIADYMNSETYKGELDNYFDVETEGNYYLKSFEDYPEVVKKNEKVIIKVNVAPDDENTIDNIMAGLKLYGVLSGEDDDTQMVNIGCKVKKVSETQLQVEIRAPKAVGNYTMVLQYGEEALAFNMMVKVNGKSGKGK